MHELYKESDLDALLEDIGDRSIVMLGEASHGTHEYYTWRTAISKRLIAEKGFRFIAVEGDWPDCYRINRYIKAYEAEDLRLPALLKTFDRWPTWMWANWEVAALAEWMKAWNSGREAGERAGFYGLDVYSLWESMRGMLAYLEKEDPEAAAAVKKAIHCFQPYENNEHLYARNILAGHSCREAVLALLQEVRSRAQDWPADAEESFNTEQNALIAVNAEKYYEAMMRFDNESWNVRDRHMMETLDRLLQLHGAGAKAIVWAHNTHIGDARATDMRRAGMINIGQLARESYGINKVYLAGFASYAGTVMAGGEWGAPMQEMDVPPARAGSFEAHMHSGGSRNRYILYSEMEEEDRTWPHRAIGVVYDPGRDGWSNYVPSDMHRRYDAVIYLDETTALHPLHLRPHDEKLPETYPFGM